MSFHIVEQANARLNRSELAVPGSKPELFEKAATSNVDVIFLDLEDSVAPDQKEQARKNIIQALNDIDWKGRKVLLRVDFNVPLDSSGGITDDTRINAAIPTIRKLSEEGASVILASHLGRPNGERVPEMSLSPVTPVLAERLGKPVLFLDD